MTAKREATEHFGQNCGAIDTTQGIGNLDEKQLPGTGRWSTSHASGARCAQQLRTHKACRPRGWARKGCMRSCPRNETQLWRQSTALAIGRREPLGLAEKGQEGSSAKPGSNLGRRSALEHDGNHVIQETRELIPGGGTERSTQVMEPAPGDEGIGLRALRTDWTVTRQSERSGRAARGRKDLLAADLHEEHQAYRRKSRAKATGGRCASATCPIGIDSTVSSTLHSLRRSDGLRGLAQNIGQGWPSNVPYTL